MCDLPKFNSDKLLVGFETSDDAAVYKINDEQALIQTLDFFTPIVDDPYTFGQIAATNALSDVYAMGGTPIVAMNIVGFPNCLSPLVLKEILRGGADKVKEAGALLVGGHSIEDNEPKYGLSVSGMVHPDKIWANNTVQEGDLLILTKPLGIGILTTALKEGLISDACEAEVVKTMCLLNKYAKEAVEAFEVHACTDVTGFGLLGHVYEMVSKSSFSVEIYSGAVPYISEAKDLGEMGIIPAGAYRNHEHIKPFLSVSDNVSEVLMDIMCDPQTSGGLLLALSETEAKNALSKLKECGLEHCAVIGKIVSKSSQAMNVL